MPIADLDLNEDWIKTRSWDLTTDLDRFLLLVVGIDVHATGTEQRATVLDWLDSQVAARAMPAGMRADLMRLPLMTGGVQYRMPRPRSGAVPDAPVRHGHADPSLIAGAMIVFEWDEDAHPRGADGRFGDGDGGGPKLPPELLLPVENSEYGGTGHDLHDGRLEAMAAALGFDGLPTPVSPAEAARLVEQGYTPIFRGLKTPEFAEQFKTGDYYGGTGVAGNGSYFSTNIDTAEAYGGGRSFDGRTASDRGSVVEGLLPPDANVVGYRELRTMHEDAEAAAGAVLDAWVADHPTEIGTPAFAEVQAATVGLYGATGVFDDPGRFAAAHGYDAIERPRGGETHYVVLNRSALSVVDPTLTASGTATFYSEDQPRGSDGRWGEGDDTKAAPDTRPGGWTQQAREERVADEAAKYVGLGATPEAAAAKAERDEATRERVGMTKEVWEGPHGLKVEFDEKAKITDGKKQEALDVCSKLKERRTPTGA